MQTSAHENWLHVSVARQTLEVRARDGRVLRAYSISTSRIGLGSEEGSYRTPLGHFRVAAKIGDGAELGAAFKGRVPTGENGLGSTEGDLVLTRILWLEGLEPHNANTKERYIYIHGTNHEDAIGQATSHGCVRIRNADAVELYDMVPAGTEVRIEEA